MREQRVICVDVPVKDVLSGNALLPHHSNQSYPLQDWRDVRAVEVPRDTLRLMYHIYAEPDQTSATLERCMSVSIADGKKDDTIRFTAVDRALSTWVNGGKPVIPPEYKPTLEEPGKVYVHCGNKVFGTHLFKPISNTRMDKPNGGFWASAKNATLSWENWTGKESFAQYSENEKIEFTVSPEARIFRIDTIDDIAYLASTYPIDYGDSELQKLGLGNQGIDWQRFAMEWDGFYYNYAALGNTMGTIDCDSLCICDPGVVRCCNPEQDISQPASPTQPLEMYAIDFYDVREIAKPEWLTSMPPYNAATLHLYTSDEPFYRLAGYKNHGARQTEWGADDRAQMFEAAVMYKVKVPAEMVQELQTKFCLQGEYITALPITPEMIAEAPQVKFLPSTFTYGRITTLPDATARASEVVTLTEFALPQWAPLPKEDKDFCEFLGATQAFEAMYGVQGFVTRGMQPEDPAWQAPLCKAAQQVHESTLPFNEKLRIMKVMDEALTKIEEQPTSKMANFRYRLVFQEMARAANETYNPAIGMAAGEWLEKLKSNPEEFIPNQEQIEL